MAFIFINVNHDVGFESSESIPISLGYVLASLKSRGGDGVILDDLQDRPLALTALEEWIHRLDPSAIGLLEEIHDVAVVIEQEDPERRGFLD